MIMGPDQKRHTRVVDLFNKARTQRYTWKEIMQMARLIGVSESTAKSYLLDVEARLNKIGVVLK